LKFRLRRGLVGRDPYHHRALLVEALDIVAKLSATAKRFFDKTAIAHRKIALAPIRLAEVIYLTEKNRLPAPAFDDLRNAPANPNHVLEEAPFTAEVVVEMRQMLRTAPLTRASL
jgi:predicted nucleic acid-binding protein